MKDRTDFSRERRLALQVLAGLSGTVLGLTLSKKWVTPSLHAVDEKKMAFLSRDPA